MPHKRRPTAYQKQIRFILIFFGLVLLLLLLGVMFLLNRPPGGYHF
jgi:hypothetical protein